MSDQCAGSQMQEDALYLAAQAVKNAKNHHAINNAVQAYWGRVEIQREAPSAENAEFLAEYRDKLQFLIDHEAAKAAAAQTEKSPGNPAGPPGG